MRILFINTLYSPDVFGGAERVLQAQVEALVEAGHEVAVLAISSEPRVSVDRVNGAKVWRVGIRNLYAPLAELQQRRHGRVAHAIWHLLDSYNPRMSRIVEKISAEFRPEVASCHNLPGWSISAWDVFAAKRIPLVQVLHDQYLLCANSMMYRNGESCRQQCLRCRALRLPHRRKSSQVDTLVGVSDFISNKFREQGYFQSARRVRTIRNIFDTRAPLPRPTSREHEHECVFGYIGRLSPSKGIEFLLQTFLATARPEWKLLVAGTGEERYQSLLMKRFLHGQIEFLGAVPAADFFARIDFTVVPSLWQDTLPSVVYESLLCGRAVAGSDTGGIPEMIDGENGLLFSPGDSAALALVLSTMAAEKAQYRSRADAIQQKAAKYADKLQWVRDWSEVYEDAVEHSRRSRS